MKPTGKSFKYRDADIFTFNDAGQITEHRSVQSGITLMDMIGAKRLQKIILFLRHHKNGRIDIAVHNPSF